MVAAEGASAPSLSPGDRVKQIGKGGRGTLKVTRVSPGKGIAMCIDSTGRMYQVKTQQLRRV